MHHCTRFINNCLLGVNTSGHYIFKRIKVTLKQQWEPDHLRESFIYRYQRPRNNYDAKHVCIDDVIFSQGCVRKVIFPAPMPSRSGYLRILFSDHCTVRTKETQKRGTASTFNNRNKKYNNYYYFIFYL